MTALTVGTRSPVTAAVMTTRPTFSLNDISSLYFSPTLTNPSRPEGSSPIGFSPSVVVVVPLLRANPQVRARALERVPAQDCGRWRNPPAGVGNKGLESRSSPIPKVRLQRAVLNQAALTPRLDDRIDVLTSSRISQSHQRAPCRTGRPR